MFSKTNGKDSNILFISLSFTLIFEWISKFTYQHPQLRCINTKIWHQSAKLHPNRTASAVTGMCFHVILLIKENKLWFQVKPLTHTFVNNITSTSEILCLSNSQDLFSLFSGINSLQNVVNKCSATSCSDMFGFLFHFLLLWTVHHVG